MTKIALYKNFGKQLYIDKDFAKKNNSSKNLSIILTGEIRIGVDRKGY